MSKGTAALFAALVFNAGFVRADISAHTWSSRTRPAIELRSSLDASPLDAIVDAAKLASAIASLATGDSVLFNAALSAAGVPPPAAGTAAASQLAQGVRIYSAISAVQSLASLLENLDDKVAHDETVVYVSQDDFEDAGLTFNVISDDDPIEQIRVAAPEDAGIRSSVSGANTREASAGVRMTPRRLQEGVYAVIFYAKEGDCHVCLSIVHTIFVFVYDPCPDLKPICRRAVANYRKQWQQMQRASAPFSVIRSHSRAAIQEIESRINACYHADGRTVTSASHDDARRRAHEDLAACEAELDQLRERLRGACPERAFNATPTECARLACQEQILAPYWDKVTQAIKRVRDLNCCHEHLNPNGSSGPNPDGAATSTAQ